MARNLLKLGALEAQRTVFLLCDVQETFRPHIKHFGEVVKVANKMLEAAKHFKIPVYVSEQYPKGLGNTTKDINLDGAALVYDKTTFSMYNQELKDRLKKDVPNLGSVVLFGIETHVCIEQTVIDLLSEDISVHVLADGVSSRSLMDRSLALQGMQYRDTGIPVCGTNLQVVEPCATFVRIATTILPANPVVKQQYFVPLCYGSEGGTTGEISST